MELTNVENDIKTLHYLIKEANKINRWRKRTLQHVLTNLAPRIAALDNQIYMGCGFHYTLVESLGSIIKELALDFQPTMNWLKKNQEEEILWIITRVKTNSLFKQVSKAEKSIHDSNQ